jgi:hypothetical protein
VEMKLILTLWSRGSEAEEYRSTIYMYLKNQDSLFSYVAS